MFDIDLGLGKKDILPKSAIKTRSIFVYGFYAPPSLILPEFEDLLDDLVYDARGRGPKVIAGDFNAWAIVWGSKETNARGRCLLKAFAQLDVVLENKGDVNIYRKGRIGSIVDLAFVSPAVHVQRPPGNHL